MRPLPLATTAAIIGTWRDAHSNCPRQRSLFGYPYRSVAERGYSPCDRLVTTWRGANARPARGAQLLIRCSACWASWPAASNVHHVLAHPALAPAPHIRVRSQYLLWCYSRTCAVCAAPNNPHSRLWCFMICRSFFPGVGFAPISEMYRGASVYS